jgi:hypothetical protein
MGTVDDVEQFEPMEVVLREAKMISAMETSDF